MSELKGTLGPWTAERNMNGQMCIWGKGWRICDINEDTNIEHQQNAQIIRKSPEMLEMLKNYLSDLENIVAESPARNNRIDSVKQLIKEATNTNQ